MRLIRLRCFVGLPMTEIHAFSTLPTASLRDVGVLGSELVAANAVSLVAPRASLIVPLLQGCCPATVLGRIRAVIVNPVDAVFRAGTRTHVAIEGLKGVLPGSANRNASPAVVPVHIIRRILASLLHACPDLILRNIGHTVSRVMANSGVGISSLQPSRVVRRAPVTTKHSLVTERALFLHAHSLAQLCVKYDGI